MTAITIPRTNAIASPPACCGVSMATMGIVEKQMSTRSVGKKARPLAMNANDTKRIRPIAPNSTIGVWRRSAESANATAAPADWMRISASPPLTGSALGRLASKVAARIGARQLGYHPIASDRVKGAAEAQAKGSTAYVLAEPVRGAV